MHHPSCSAAHFFCHISLWTYLKKRFAWKFPNSPGTFFNSCRFWSPGEWVCSIAARGENVRAEGNVQGVPKNLVTPKWKLQQRVQRCKFFMRPFLMKPQLLVVAPQAYHCLYEILFDLKEYKLSIYGRMVVSLCSGFHFWPSLFGQDCQCVGVSDRIHSVRNKKLSISCLKDHIDRNCFDLLTLFLWTRNKQAEICTKYLTVNTTSSLAALA